MHTNPAIDAKASQLWLERVPPRSPWLHTEVANRMQERLDWLTLIPADVLHWGSVRGDWDSVAALRQRYPQANTWVVEQTPAHWAWARTALQAKTRQRWWRYVLHSGQALQAVQAVYWPLNQDQAVPTAVDMIWCNMLLHQLANPRALLQRFAHLLRPGGVLMFSCLGPDTLQSLRSIYNQHGWGEPCQSFTDMHDWGDDLVHCGFEGPVMDMETIILRYENPIRALQELRELGRNLNPKRFSACRTRQWRRCLENALGAQPELVFEIVYGHAIWPEQTPITMQETTRIGIESMRQQLKNNRSSSGKSDAL